jgi:quercetin dioxygenase-like cupin family protein
MEKESRTDKSLLATGADIASLVDYQNSTVVSRTIIERNTGTVTLFAFDKGQGLSEHTVPFDALVYVIDGRVSITIGGEVISLKAGEATIMPANKPHSLRAVERFKMMLIMIRDS